MSDVIINTIFTNSQVIFEPGDNVNGAVSVALKKSLRFTKIILTCKGTIEKTTRTSAGKRRRTISEKTAIFRSAVIALEATALVNKLHVGEHVFPFTFCLPSQIPESFFAAFGSNTVVCSYCIQAEIGVLGMFSLNKKTIAPFTVLAKDTSVQKTLTQFVEENIFSFCCFSRGILKWNVSIPQSTFYFGDVVPVTISLDMSLLDKGHAFFGIRAVIRRTIDFSVRFHDRHITECVHYEKCTMALTASGVHYMELQLPKKLEPSADHLYFKCQYSIKVSVDGSVWTASSVKIPITIKFGRRASSAAIGLLPPPMPSLTHDSPPPEYSS